jgi:VID27 C-terminal WD40-like domain
MTPTKKTRSFLPLILRKVCRVLTALASNLKQPPEPSDEEEEEDELASDEDEDAQGKLTKGEKNSQLAVGYKGDRSYVVRGNTIGVFDQKVQYVATIGNIATPKGVELRPDNVSVPLLMGKVDD